MIHYGSLQESYSLQRNLGGTWEDLEHEPLIDYGHAKAVLWNLEREARDFGTECSFRILRTTTEVMYGR